MVSTYALVERSPCSYFNDSVGFKDKIKVIAKIIVKVKIKIKIKIKII
jgi:hypothetical protein